MRIYVYRKNGVRAGDMDHIWTMTVKRRRQYLYAHRGNDDRSPVPTHKYKIGEKKKNENKILAKHHLSSCTLLTTRIGSSSSSSISISSTVGRGGVCIYINARAW